MTKTTILPFITSHADLVFGIKMVRFNKDGPGRLASWHRHTCSKQKCYCSMFSVYFIFTFENEILSQNIQKLL